MATREQNDKVLIQNAAGFSGAALDLFRFQYEGNPVYRSYVQALGVAPETVDAIEKIPFLPVSFFKTQVIKTGSFEPQIIFESSGTTGMVPSRHFVKERQVYEESFLEGFRLFYGEPSSYCVIGLLPSYLERKGSSLVYMTDRLIKESGHPYAGFYLNQYDELHRVLQQLEQAAQPTLLIGVSFALLDFAEQYPMNLSHTMVMETGGMKGRRHEMIRQELHAVLKKHLGLAVLHAEYGMTELLSQAYATRDGIFSCPPWMKVLLREEEDPLAVQQGEGRGLINIIDLANRYSCAFIATDDAGRLYADGSFEVLGRRDGSDLRGCSLLVL